MKKHDNPSPNGTTEWDETVQLVPLEAPATFSVTEHAVEHIGVKRTPKTIMPIKLNTKSFLKGGFI